MLPEVWAEGKGGSGDRPPRYGSRGALRRTRCSKSWDR